MVVHCAWLAGNRPQKGRCFFQGKNINQYVVTVPPTFEQLSSGPPRCGILLAFSQLRFLEKTKWRGIWWHHPGVMKYHQPKQCIIIRVFFLENYHRFDVLLFDPSKNGKFEDDPRHLNTCQCPQRVSRIYSMSTSSKRGETHGRGQQLGFWLRHRRFRWEWYNLPLHFGWFFVVVHVGTSKYTMTWILLVMLTTQVWRIESANPHTSQPWGVYQPAKFPIFPSEILSTTSIWDFFMRFPTQKKTTDQLGQ